MSQLFIRDLKRSDAVDKKKTFPEGFLRDKYGHMAGYEDFVKSIGINFHSRVNNDTKKLDYRDLTGQEKLKLFRTSRFPLFLIQVIWDDFMALIGDLNYTSEDSISYTED